MLTDREVQRLVARIVSIVAPEQIIVFGSHAKGTATPRSDLDILVIMETDLPMAVRADRLRVLSSTQLFPLDFHVYTPEEVEEYGRDPWSFIRTVLETGKIVYSKARVSNRL